MLSTYCQTLSSQCCFEDLYPKIHLQFILNAEESLEALKTLGRRLPRFLEKLNNIFENWLKKSKNMYISYNIEIQFPTQKFYCWEDLSKLLLAWQILTMKNLHFPLKIFVSSKIFEELGIFEYLRRIFELTMNLHIDLWYISRNWRIFVFVFSPFSIFVATLSLSIYLSINHSISLYLWEIDIELTL